MRRARDIPAAIVALRIAVAESLGADRVQIVREAKLSPEIFTNPKARGTVEQAMDVWKVIVRQTGSHDIGLECGLKSRFQTMGILGYVMMNSPSITLAWRKLCNYQELVLSILLQKMNIEGALIDSPVEKVWDVLMNHKSYPEWNPFIKKISGSTQPGDCLQVTIQSEGNNPMDFKPLVLVNNPNQEFRWVGKLGFKGVFDGEHYFILEQVGVNQTKFRHGENFRGILSGLLMKIIGEDTEAGFRAMNKAIKLRSESN